MNRPVLPSIHLLIRDERPNETASLTLAPLQISPQDHSSRPRHASHEQRHVARSLSEPSPKTAHNSGPHQFPHSLPHSRKPSEPSHNAASSSSSPNHAYAQHQPYGGASPSDYFQPNAPHSRPTTSSGMPDYERLAEDGEDIFSASMKYECNVCMKRFYRPSGLRIHLASHSNDKLNVVAAAAAASLIRILLHAETAEIAGTLKPLSHAPEGFAADFERNSASVSLFQRSQAMEVFDDDFIDAEALVRTDHDVLMEDVSVWDLLDPPSFLSRRDGGNIGSDSEDWGNDDETDLSQDSPSQGIEAVEELVLSFLGQLQASVFHPPGSRQGSGSTEGEGSVSQRTLDKPSRRTPRIQLELADRRKIMPDGSPGTRSIYYPKNSQSPSAKPFAQLLRVMDCIHEALIDDAPTTKRDLYYKDVSLFKSQGVVDKIIDDLAATFHLERSDLNMRATSKGLVSGSSLRIHLHSGETIEVTDTEGSSVPVGEDILTFTVIHPISWILIVEKDVRLFAHSDTTYNQPLSTQAVFQTLCRLRVTDHPDFPGRGLLITGKGYPDIATRQLVKTLSDNLPDTVPILALVDGDPYGLDILSTYKYGSNSLKHENHKLAAERVQWVGLRIGELADFQIEMNSLIPITRHDEKKALSMLSRQLTLPQAWRKELMRMLHMRRKAEIEVLSTGRTQQSALLSSGSQSSKSSRPHLDSPSQQSHIDLLVSDCIIQTSFIPGASSAHSPLLRYLIAKLCTAIMPVDDQGL
ncbi:DNA topoisomerase IV, alpha subunit [Pleurotus eryngii]|uniref:DNA topoisomerase (ATP-hydrolyzing) n=1 Tax=Pleurotus eryngii TaxID=5323 RepID=A0A9P6AC11_PLEER|nr:DNA topoisomerase IV, alpha subunit [Pleurotus eryngii]